VAGGIVVPGATSSSGMTLIPGVVGPDTKIANKILNITDYYYYYYSFLHAVWVRDYSSMAEIAL
jgi:hypothetical protein